MDKSTAGRSNHIRINESKEMAMDNINIIHLKENHHASAAQWLWNSQEYHIWGIVQLF